ncbi:MAG: sigma-70 family RNA polymerase sigma factor [Polyangiaceae bacterium]
MSDLVSRAQEGDADALRELLTDLGPKVHRFGLRLCRSEADAEDATQETLLHLATRLRDFQGRSALSSYAFTVVRTACNRRRRGLKNQHHEVLSEALVDGHKDPETRVVDADLARRVDRALEQLPEEYREVLWLRDAEGLTAPETAEAIGLSVAAVKSRLHRARRALKDALHPVLAPSDAGQQCPDVAELLSQQLEGELTPDACDRMQRHLDGCSDCDATCRALKQALHVCRQSSHDRVVPECVRNAVQIALDAYRDGQR